MSKYKIGTTLIFDPNSFNTTFWQNLSEEDKIKYYGKYGYGQSKKKLFSFLFEHKPQHGHCALVDMDTKKILTMCHTSEFKPAMDYEC